MTKVKLCGLSRESDIAAVNKLKPDLVGFVFAKKSKRYVSPEQAAALKSLLAPGILAAGVFVNEPVEAVAKLLGHGVIDAAHRTLFGGAGAFADAVRDEVDGVVTRHLLLLQEISGMALALGKDRDERVGAGHFLAAG